MDDSKKEHKYFVAILYNNSLGPTIEVTDWDQGLEVIYRWAEESNIHLTEQDKNKIDEYGEIKKDGFNFCIGIIECLTFDKKFEIFETLNISCLN
jgi:hypothetical protein